MTAGRTARWPWRRPPSGADGPRADGAGAGQPAGQRAEILAGRDPIEVTARRPADAEIRWRTAASASRRGPGADVRQVLPRAASGRVGGTGLGLSICKGIVEAQGGRLGPESPRGRDGRHCGAALRRHRVPEGGDDRKGTRVLVVDDEPAIRRFLRASLTAHGYVVFEAETGREALSAVVAHRPDLVVLDLGLPDLDGIEVDASAAGMDARADHRPVGARARGGQDGGAGRRAPTTTSPSRSASGSCWPGCGRLAPRRSPRRTARSSPGELTVDLPGVW